MKVNSLITLTTDFGISDPFVGIMKGVMLSINPSIKFIDISHQVEPQNIIQAYLILSYSYKYFPSGTIHLSVVDPDVGSKRRPILIKSGKYYFIGPDNGIFSFIFKNDHTHFSSPLKGEGGVRVFELTENKFFLPSVSSTFHGRDIFASVAAHLSRGVKPSEFGKPINNPVMLKIPEPSMRGNEIRGEVIYIDRFGNLITNVSLDKFYKTVSGLKSKNFNIRIKDLKITHIYKSYSDAEDLKPSSIFNSWRLLEIFIKNSNASRKLGIKRGEKVLIKIKD